MLDDALCLTCF